MSGDSFLLKYIPIISPWCPSGFMQKLYHAHKKIPPLTSIKLVNGGINPYFAANIRRFFQFATIISNYFSFFPKKNAFFFIFI